MTTPTLRRRTAIAAMAATTLGVAASAVRAHATKLRISTIPIFDIAPLQGGAAGIPALAAGQIQIAFSNIVSTILAAKQGLGLEIIAAASNTGDAPPDLAGLIAKKGAPQS